MKRRTFLKAAGVALLAPIVPDWDLPALPETREGGIWDEGWQRTPQADGYWSGVVTPNGGNIIVSLPTGEDVIFPSVAGNTCRAWWDGGARVELVEV